HRALAPPIALDDRRLERLLALPQPYLASLGLQAALVVASAGIATRLAALIPLCIAQPICLGIEAFNVSSTVPRTTRSRWLLIRSSSIVMTLFSRLGVSQGRAPLSQNRKCERLFNTKARSAVASARAAAIRNQQREEFSAVLCQLS